MAFAPDRVQSHLEHLIKQMCSTKALKLAQFSEKREAGSQLSFADLEQKNTKMDFKAFVEEFQTQVLGIGKAAAPNQARYGAPNIPQFLSFPSNEKANQLFSSALQRAVTETCDISVKQPKQADQQPLKSKQVVDQASQIQLKQSVVEDLKAQKAGDNQLPTSDTEA